MTQEPTPSTAHLDVSEILRWLREDDPTRLEPLWQAADEVRRAAVGDEVHLRGLLEISNHCARRCAYCGISCLIPDVERYRMSEDEIIRSATWIAESGCGTVVMQAGEDHGIEAEWLSDIIRQIKTETSLAVTLSLGERAPDELAAWRDAGADRYLLRFETSDPELYALIHPARNGEVSHRIGTLLDLRNLGYEIGGGVMVGIPGQTFETLARDLMTFANLDLDMIGLGPYLPHPATPLGSGRLIPPDAGADQVPNDEATTHKALALTRLLCPQANIPSTTALATINRRNGWEVGLAHGANVFMPNFTPLEYQAKYQIYPGKTGVTRATPESLHLFRSRLRAAGREPGHGRGDRRRAVLTR